MLTITVTTVVGSPTFEVPAGTSPAVVRQMVAHKFGYQALGIPHCWTGNQTA